MDMTGGEEMDMTGGESIQKSGGTRARVRPRAATHFRKVNLVAIAFTLAALLAATPAQANVGETIIRRCTNNESLSGFSQTAYKQALEELSAGTEEYSNCAQLIRQAQLAAATGHGAATGGPAAPNAQALTPTPAEQKAISHAPDAGSAPVEVGGQTIHPGVVHADIASALSTLPTPLLATVTFLLVGLLLAAGAGVRNRVRTWRAR
jgi:hypothetical protein